MSFDVLTDERGRELPARRGRMTAYEAIPHGRSRAGTRWTHELIAYALDRFHRRHFRTPTLREFKAGNSDLPSFATIKRHYGSVGRMLVYHGYRVRPAGGQPGHRCTLERDAAGLFLPSARR